MPADPWRPVAGEPIDLRSIVEDAFGDDEEAALAYADALRGAASDLAASIARTVLLLLVLAGLFLLVTFADAAETRVTVGPLGLSDLSAIERATPALMAYLVYQLAGLTARYSRVDWVTHQLMFRYRPALARNKLHELLMPSLPRLYEIGAALPKGTLELIRDGAGLILTVTLIVAPAVFEVFAFGRLFDRYGFDDAVVWVSFAIALVAGVSTLATYLHMSRHSMYELRY